MGDSLDKFSLFFHLSMTYFVFLQKFHSSFELNIRVKYSWDFREQITALHIRNKKNAILNYGYFLNFFCLYSKMLVKTFCEKYNIIMMKKKQARHFEIDLFSDKGVSMTSIFQEFFL